MKGFTNLSNTERAQLKIKNLTWKDEGHVGPLRVVLEEMEFDNFSQKLQNKFINYTDGEKGFNDRVSPKWFNVFQARNIAKKLNVELEEF